MFRPLTDIGTHSPIWTVSTVSFKQEHGRNPTLRSLSIRSFGRAMVSLTTSCSRYVTGSMITDRVGNGCGAERDASAHAFL